MPTELTTIEDNIIAAGVRDNAEFIYQEHNTEIYATCGDHEKAYVIYTWNPRREARVTVIPSARIQELDDAIDGHALESDYTQSRDGGSAENASSKVAGEVARQTRSMSPLAMDIISYWSDGDA